MANISVHLLGRPYVEVDGERVNFPYKKAEGFFYYLCVKKTATREEIIYVLWGADNENVGRKNLREAVYQIKKLLGKEILVTAGHTSISLNPECMPEMCIRDRNLFRSLYFAPVVISMTCCSMVWLWIYNDLYGVLNYLLQTLGIIPVSYTHLDVYKRQGLMK